MRRAGLFGVSALLLRVALAQTQPDAAEILKNVSATYKAASQYEFVADATLHDPRMGTIRSHVLIAFRTPDKYRMEGGFPGMRIGNSDLSEAVVVHDGSALWFYFPKANQYASIPAEALTSNPRSDAGDLRPQVVDYLTRRRYTDAQLATGSKFVREEAIEFGGAQVACYVVMASPERRGSSYTFWVDKTNYHVLREERDGSSVVFTVVKLDEPLADQLFQFKPPRGARKIKMRH
jgi:outer membrane lipoprotein-sorting protein